MNVWFQIINSELGHALLVLPLVILGNVLFGAVLSDFKGNYNPKIMQRGLLKGVTIYLGIALFCGVSYFTQNLKIQINGNLYTLMDAMYGVIWGAVLAYSADAMQKLMIIFKQTVKKEDRNGD